MYGNVINGGLVVRYMHKEIISDFIRYWYMNTDGESVFFGDGLDRHYLYRTSEEDPEGSVILKKPCAYIMLFGDWLYFINEDDHRVYRCLRNGHSESLMMRDEVVEFLPFGKSNIICVTKAGDIKNLDTIMAKGIYPARLNITGGKLFFADGSNNYYLSCIDLDPAGEYQVKCLGNIVPTSINGCGQLIYFTNALSENNIYRMDVSGGPALKICGESAQNLHIIDRDIYFWNGSVWKKLSLDGGAAKEVE